MSVSAAAGFAPGFFGVTLVAACGTARPPGLCPCVPFWACCASAGTPASATQTMMPVTRVFIPASRRPIEDSATTPRRNLAGSLTCCSGGRSVAAMLSAEELERYARHIVLLEVGGLGAPVLLYLAAAGVGTLGVIDDDVVTLSNLQRQVIHETPDVGMAKVESAAATIRKLNPHVAVEAHGTRLVAGNALDLIGRYDIVADGSDNFATRYLVSDACYFAKKPLVTAALGTFDATLTTIRAHERGADGKP